MDQREQRREHQHRLRTLRVLGTVAAVGVALLLGYEAWLRHVAEFGFDDPDRAMRQVAMASTLINLAIAAMALLLARYLADWARQTREQRQWPPAGLQLLGQRPVRHGDDARRVASRLQAAAIGSVGLAVAVMAWTAWRLLS
ncbi:hypothetical protein [Arenimonas sp. MALMAid1274]|uniref:hypothetical protein n=1 Tax=Arenimonas sp. MALMAid1274 TaxID=3411630 RepID=UPI003B9EA730